MKTLNERLVDAFNILIDNRVFLVKYNMNPFCNCPDEQLQLVTNYLSVRDIKIMLSVCELFSLDFGINEIPSSTGHSLSVIFSDLNNG